MLRDFAAFKAALELRGLALPTGNSRFWTDGRCAQEGSHKVAQPGWHEAYCNICAVIRNRKKRKTTKRLSAEGGVEEDKETVKTARGREPECPAVGRLARVQVGLASLGIPMTRRATSKATRPTPWKKKTMKRSSREKTKKRGPPRGSGDASEFLGATERSPRPPVQSVRPRQRKEGGNIAPEEGSSIPTKKLSSGPGRRVLGGGRRVVAAGVAWLLVAWARAGCGQWVV